LLHLAACVLLEAHDEWRVADCRYLSDGSMAQLTPPAPTTIAAATETEVLDGTVQRTAQSERRRASPERLHHSAELNHRVNRLILCVYPKSRFRQRHP
jgi:hypothetical protein